MQVEKKRPIKHKPRFQFDTPFEHLNGREEDVCIANLRRYRPMNTLFEPGKVIASRSAKNLLGEVEAVRLIQCHLYGDHGLIADDRLALNQDSIHGKRGDSVISQYASDGRYYVVITTSDKDYTLLMTDKEYETINLSTLRTVALGY